MTEPMEHETTRVKLSPPSLQEVADIWAAALPRNYVESSATVVDCPDLRQPPFHLATEGLCGIQTVADIGGQGNLYPEPRRDKNFSMTEMAQLMELDPKQGSLIGAGAGPNRVLGYNSELAPNLSWQGGLDHVTNLTHSIRIAGDDHHVECPLSNSTECALMVNLYGSLGLPGPVLRVTARGRRGSAGSLTEFLRDTLREAYGAERQVTIGGAFVLKAGRARFHVMPDFPPSSELPFPSRKALEGWLTYHDFPGPIVCLSVFHSADPQKLGLRMEHTHCFAADKTRGGHYHYDVSRDGEEVEYEGYFNIAQTLVRVDRSSADWEIV